MLFNRAVVICYISIFCWKVTSIYAVLLSLQGTVTVFNHGWTVLSSVSLFHDGDIVMKSLLLHIIDVTNVLRRQVSVKTWKVYFKRNCLLWFCNFQLYCGIVYSPGTASAAMLSVLVLNHSLVLRTKSFIVCHAELAVSGVNLCFLPYHWDNIRFVAPASKARTAACDIDFDTTWWCEAPLLVSISSYVHLQYARCSFTLQFCCEPTIKYYIHSRNSRQAADIFTTVICV